MTQVQPNAQSGIAYSLQQNKTILFPTDFSEVAHNAFQYALELADGLSARIVLLHVNFETNLKSEWVPEEFIQALRDEKTEKAMKFFHEYQREAQLTAGKSIEVSPMIAKGHAADEIIRISQRDDIGLIIMGTLGAESLAEKIMGSVTAKVIEGAKCPVLAVPAEARYRPIRHLMFATAFEAQDSEVIRQLLVFAQLFDATLSCSHIRTQKGEWDKVDIQTFEEIYELELKDDRLRFYLSNDVDIIHGLNRFVEDHKVDIVVMLNHRHHFLDRMLRESHTREMALHSSVPVLALHDH